jgi:hypothetical protein
MCIGGREGIEIAGNKMQRYLRRYVRKYIHITKER